jgi:hypothetical protein
MEARHASAMVTDAATDRQGSEVVPLDRAS